MKFIISASGKAEKAVNYTNRKDVSLYEIKQYQSGNGLFRNQEKNHSIEIITDVTTDYN